jgi:hypothetical protein
MTALFRLGHVATITAAVVAVFSGLLSTSGRAYLQYDDEKNYDELPQLQEWTVASFRWAINDGEVLGVYEPTSIVFKMLWHRLSDGGGAYVCAVVNVSLHLTNCILTYSLWRPAGSLLCREPCSPGCSSTLHRSRRVAWDECCFLSTLFFGIHPLRVETVCWASCQPYLIAGLLLNLSAHAFRECRTPREPAGNWESTRLALSVAAFFLAVFAKAAAVPVAGLVSLAEFQRALPSQAFVHKPTTGGIARPARDTDACENTAEGGASPSAEGGIDNGRADCLTGQGLFDIVRHRLRWKRVFLYLGLGVFAAIPASTANPAGQVGGGELSPFQIILKACYTLFKYPVATIVPTKLSLRYRVAGSGAGIQLANPWYAASLVGVGLLLGWLSHGRVCHSVPISI